MIEKDVIVKEGIINEVIGDFGETYDVEIDGFEVFDYLRGLLPSRFKKDKEYKVKITIETVVIK